MGKIKKKYNIRKKYGHPGTQQAQVGWNSGSCDDKSMETRL
jgi:hypothetical protein